MCEKDALQFEKKTRQEIKTEIIQQLAAQHTWDLQEGQTMEQRRNEERERIFRLQSDVNIRLAMQLEQTYGNIRADEAAQGSPVQKLAPAKQSWKQRQEMRSRAKKAQKHNKFADHISYTMQTELQRLQQERQNSLDADLQREAEQNDVNIQVLNAYISGYRKDRNGNPLNQAEAEKKNLDAEFLRDYISKDPQRREKHLNRIKAEMFNTVLNENIYNANYLQQNPGEVSRIFEKLTHFKEVMDDPINAAYFENLPALEKEILQAQFSNGYEHLKDYLRNQFARKGVSLETGKYYEKKNTLDAQMLQSSNNAENQQLIRNRMKEGEAAVKARTEEVLKRHLESILPKYLQDNLDFSNREVANFANDPDLIGLNLTTYATSYTLMEFANMRERFMNAPQQYAKYQTQLNQLYQQFYRTMDSIGDLTNLSVAYQKITAEYSEQDYPFDGISEMAYLEQSELTIKSVQMRRHAENLTDLILFYLDDSRFLLDSSMKAAKDYGLLEEVQKIEAQRLAAERQTEKQAERTETVFEDYETLFEEESGLEKTKENDDPFSEDDFELITEEELGLQKTKEKDDPADDDDDDGKDEMVDEKKKEEISADDADDLDDFELITEEELGLQKTKENNDPFDEDDFELITEEELGLEKTEKKENLLDDEDFEILSEEDLRIEKDAKKPQQKKAAAVGSLLRRTKEEAISTYSDQLSQQKREDLHQLRQQLGEQAPALGKALDAYYEGTRYAVGYTEERRRLKVLLKVLQKELDAAKKAAPPYMETLQSIKRLMDATTNGKLIIPNGAKVLDYSKMRPEEHGKNQVAGNKRNFVLRGLSRWSDQRDTPLFSHEPTVNDLKQRFVSNCYMVAGTAGLVNIDPELLKECLVDNQDGTVTVRLFVSTDINLDESKASEYQGGADNPSMDAAQEETYIRRGLRPVYVKVSKEIPRIGGIDTLSSGALWMQMIEKACAFIGKKGDLKGYRSLWYGEGGDFLKTLLGVPQKQVQYEYSDDVLFQRICDAQQNGFVYNTGSFRGAGEGLNAGHAYTVMGGKEVDGQRYVLLRNPYSTMSLEYQEDQSKSRTGHFFPAHSDETYGQFYITFEDFRQNFFNITELDLNQVQRNPQA